jgi:hypothetical protein
MRTVRSSKILFWVLAAGMLMPIAGFANTITFDAAGVPEITVGGPFVETDGGVTLTLSSNVHLHMGDWSDDGSNPDLRNHAGIIDTFQFSEAVDIIGFDVVSGNQFGPGGNVFTSETGHQFSVDSLGFFDISNSGFASEWQGISEFTWQVFGNELVIDNLQFEPSVAPVPVPASIWLFGSALLGLLRFRRRQA